MRKGLRSNLVVNFRKLGLRLPTDVLYTALDKKPQLWALDTFWKTHPIPIFGEVDTIYLRFPDKQVFLSGQGDVLTCFDQPALVMLPEAIWPMFALMQYVKGKRLGRVLVNRLMPGGRVLPHSDGKDLFYSRYHIVLASNEGVEFRCGKEYARMKKGEVWWFDNSEEHEVMNKGSTPRIHMIVDIA